MFYDASNMIVYHMGVMRKVPTNDIDPYAMQLTVGD